MALVIEDGSIVANANSYATLAAVRTYALTRGVTLSADDAVLEPQVLRAMDYIEHREDQYVGTIVVGTQALAWPRLNAYWRRIELGDDEIPAPLLYGLYELTMAVHAGVNLLPTTTASDYVIRKKVGPMEVEYSDPLSVGIEAMLTAAEGWLSQLYSNSGAGFVTVRA